MITYDLHVHTTASDGLFTPSQVIEKAVRAGLKGIAITDHDTVDGIAEAIGCAAQYPGFVVVPGIELNTNQDQQSVHVLGYGMDFTSYRFVEKLGQMRQWREERAQAIVQKLKCLGYSIEYDEVQHQAQGAIGRPHIARVLAKKNLVPSANWAFGHLLTRGKPAYVPRHPFTPIDATNLIHEFHGIAVLAHPGLIHHQNLVTDLLDRHPACFEGIEVYYPAHEPYQVEKYRAMAETRGLLMTGGSDFHGEGTSEHAPNIGFRGINDELYSVFQKEINI